MNPYQILPERIKLIVKKHTRDCRNQSYLENISFPGSSFKKHEFFLLVGFYKTKTFTKKRFEVS